MYIAVRGVDTGAAVGGPPEGGAGARLPGREAAARRRRHEHGENAAEELRGRGPRRRADEVLPLEAVVADLADDEGLAVERDLAARAAARGRPISGPVLGQ